MTLALKGARAIFNPTYGYHNEFNLCMMRSRSTETETIIAFTHPEQSLITGPRGGVIANNENNDDEFTVTEIDLGEVDDSRGRETTQLKDRRPDVYEL